MERLATPIQIYSPTKDESDTENRFWRVYVDCAVAVVVGIVVCGSVVDSMSSIIQSHKSPA
jgi:putative effector of murein hydrolase LrgA (UPF0299 family)